MMLKYRYSESTVKPAEFEVKKLCTSARILLKIVIFPSGASQLFIGHTKKRLLLIRSLMNIQDC